MLLSNLISKVTKAVGNDITEIFQTEVVICEELMRHIENINKVLVKVVESDQRPTRQNTLPSVQVKGQPIVGSMDVKALDPSILMRLAAKAAREAVAKSKLEWKNIDVTYQIR